MKQDLRQHTDLKRGLCQQEVERRRQAGEYNEQLERTTKSYQAIVRDNLFTLFNLINIILAALVFITGNYRNMLFMGVVLSNLAIGIFQEIRSKRVLDRLSLLSANHVQVLRDGKAMQITLEEIVLDDLLVLANGDQIPCDAIVVQGKLECNESLVTGEAEVIRKEEGSFLSAGSAWRRCAPSVKKRTYIPSWGMPNRCAVTLPSCGMPSISSSRPPAS